MSWGDDNTIFRVVVNDEEQYSIWPDYRAMPAGWRDAGKSGKKDECLAWIDQVWTDMRPLSLRKAMAASDAQDASRSDSSAA
jgi:MbtH protein